MEGEHSLKGAAYDEAPDTNTILNKQIKLAFSYISSLWLVSQKVQLFRQFGLAHYRCPQSVKYGSIWPRRGRLHKMKSCRFLNPKSNSSILIFFKWHWENINYFYKMGFTQKKSIASWSNQTHFTFLAFTFWEGRWFEDQEEKGDSILN